MNNMFGAKMGQIFIPMSERNESAVGSLRWMEEMKKPIPKPILPGPPKQIFQTKKLKSILTPEESKRVKLENQLKDYIAYKPPKFNKEELLQGLMIKELLNKQLERNKKLREQVKKGMISPEEYEKMKVKEHVLQSQTRTLLPLIEEPLMAMGVNTDRMENFLSTVRMAEGDEFNFEEPDIERVARESADTMGDLLEAQNRRAVELAPVIPTNPIKTPQSTATRVENERRRGRPLGTTREAMIIRRQEEEQILREAQAIKQANERARMTPEEEAALVREQEQRAMEERRQALRQQVAPRRRRR
jgi:hypothetical protein